MAFRCYTAKKPASGFINIDALITADLTEEFHYLGKNNSLDSAMKFIEQIPHHLTWGPFSDNLFQVKIINNSNDKVAAAGLLLSNKMLWLNPAHEEPKLIKKTFYFNSTQKRYNRLIANLDY
jgi:hypothetical protein